jgi:hypothetical protein
MSDFVKEARARAEAAQRAAESTTAYRVTRRFYQVMGGLDVITRVGKRFLWRASWPGRKLWGLYFGVWDWFVNSAPTPFKRRRAAAAMITATFIFAWWVMLPLLGFLVDASLYAATVKRDEVVYMFNSQEISGEDNVHSVQGCHSLPCTDANSIYFRIRGTWFNEVWSVLNHGALFFPDFVAAAIPVTVSECKITSYGLRAKLFMRGVEVYPDLLASSCTPVNGVRSD